MQNRPHDLGVLHVDVQVHAGLRQGLLLEHLLEGRHVVLEPLAGLGEGQVFDPLACRPSGGRGEGRRGTVHVRYFAALSEGGKILVVDNNIWMLQERAVIVGGKKGVRPVTVGKDNKRAGCSADKANASNQRIPVPWVCRPGTLTGLFDEGVVMADNDPIRGREDVKLDHIHAKPDGLQERRHRVALHVPAVGFFRLAGGERGYV